MARFLIFFLLFSVARPSVKAQEMLSCSEVGLMVSPCLAYLAGLAREPYGPCCGAVVALSRTVLTGPDQATVCRCLKGIASRLPVVNVARAAALPRACGVTGNVTISPSVDCSRLLAP
ncbi:non-specific lipid-transfer protein D-like [Phalaenopsis equestris]|uniref:non-specific lipid-transfer protein D-like n=1 Tax=Phalaenopsis equestris TaxID=78828 RepID=UPI0009E5BB7B|nr:non-specific lipid-transfer protein D-like [Phalaenopsis equestris]